MSSRLDRLISLDAYIRSGVMPGIEQLCRLFEVQPRTIYQDLRELREKFGLDIRYDRDRNGYYNAQPHKRLPSIAMTDEEVLLLLVASEMLCHHGGPSFRGGLANVIQTLAGDRQPGWGSRIQETLEFDGEKDQISKSTFMTILQACLNEVPVELTHYNQSQQECIVSLMPKRISHGSGWELRGQLLGSEEQVSIPLKLIVSCEMLSFPPKTGEPAEEDF